MSFRAACLSLSLSLSLLAAPALAEVPNVVTDIAPVHSLAAKVMEGVGTPELILPPGASPHGHALRPGEAKALAGADLVFRVGGGLTPWLDGALETLAGNARVLALMDVPGAVRLEFRESENFTDAANGADDGHDHAEDGLDPHGWLDPENAGIWLAAMAGALADADPENATLYRANAERAQVEIATAAARVAVFLAPHRKLRFVALHDAYQYFERYFGLTVVGAISNTDAQRPGPARLARLRDRLAGLDIACVFAEPQFDRDLVAAVVPGGRARVAVLDPLGAAIAPGPDFYIDLLKDMADAVANCR